MKKALIATISTLAAASIFAAPVVYDVTIKGKSTTAKSGKITAACLVEGQGKSVTYRKQGTINLNLSNGIYKQLNKETSTHNTKLDVSTAKGKVFPKIKQKH